MVKVLHAFVVFLQLCAAQDAVAPVVTGPIPFTTTEELYSAVDDYLSGNGANTTSSAITYGYPIGSWDVSLLTNFSMVFDANRQSIFDDFATEIRYMPYDISSWDVSNAVDMSRMFRATTFNGDLAVSNLVALPCLKINTPRSPLLFICCQALEYESLKGHKYERNVFVCTGLCWRWFAGLASLERYRLLVHVWVCRAIQCPNR